MNTQAPDGPPTTYAVLDIETAPDPRPLVPPSAGAAGRSSHSHIIKAAAMLTATRNTSADWSVERLQSWSCPRDEHATLRSLRRALASELIDGVTLVTFNGVRHDVPVILRRAAFHRMFGSRAWGALGGRHLDLMTDGISGPHAQWASLAQTCAGLGIPSDHAFPAAATATPDPARRKCETDVCATFVLLIYTLAMESGDARDLERGWRALANHVRSEHRARPHLVQFAEAGEDQCIWSS